MTRKMIRALVVLVTSMLVVSFFLSGCSQNSNQGTEGSSDETGIVAGTSNENDTSKTESETEKASGGEVNESSLKTYSVVRVDGEPDWGNVPVLDINNQQWLDPVDISAYAQLCYSDDAFYVRMWAQEEHIRAEYPESDLLANTYEDSCLEFFIAPVTGDVRYLNLEFNPNCAVGVQIGTTKTDRTRLVRTDNLFNAVSTRTEDGWEITYCVPFDFIRSFYPEFFVESGMQLRGNFYKCGNLTDQKHYLSWNAIESDTPNFHKPECFGVLKLEA